MPVVDRSEYGTLNAAEQRRVAVVAASHGDGASPVVGLGDLQVALLLQVHHYGDHPQALHLHLGADLVERDLAAVVLEVLDHVPRLHLALACLSYHDRFGLLDYPPASLAHVPCHQAGAQGEHQGVDHDHQVYVDPDAQGHVEYGEQQACAHDGEHCAVLAHAHVEQLVVYVVLVGQEGVVAGADSGHVHAHHVEAWHHQRAHGHHQHVHARQLRGRGHLHHLEAQDAEDDADRERACVAHEYLLLLLGVAEDVVVEERQQHTQGGEAQDRVEVLAAEVEGHAVDYHGHRAQARGQAVDAVDQVDGVDYENPQQQCEGPHAPPGDLLQAEESVEVGHAQAADHQHRHAADLHHELGAVLDADQVVGQAHDVEHQQGAEAEGYRLGVGEHLGEEGGAAHGQVDAQQQHD